MFNAWLKARFANDHAGVLYRQDGNRLTFETECLRSHTLPSIAYGFKKRSLEAQDRNAGKILQPLIRRGGGVESGCRVNKYIGYDRGRNPPYSHHAAAIDEVDKK